MYVIWPYPTLHIQLDVIRYSDLVRSLASSGSSRDEVISWNVFDFLAGVSSPPLPCVSKRHCQAFCWRRSKRKWSRLRPNQGTGQDTCLSSSQVPELTPLSKKRKIPTRYIIDVRVILLLFFTFSWRPVLHSQLVLFFFVALRRQHQYMPKQKPGGHRDRDRSQAQAVLQLFLFWFSPLWLCSCRYQWFSSHGVCWCSHGSVLLL